MEEKFTLQFEQIRKKDKANAHQTKNWNSTFSQKTKKELWSNQYRTYEINCIQMSRSQKKDSLNYED